MRAVPAVLALALLALFAIGCAELGASGDGTSISYGKPSKGRLIDGVKMPDAGSGYTTREMWSKRGNRYGTDELVYLLKQVSKRMKKKVKDVRLVIADLSGTTGGPELAFHRSHQSGRDVDLLYYMRGPDGKPFEADAMHVFNANAAAKDGSGITVDIPRTWLLVKELLTAREATVQYIFMYRPILEKVIDHAKQQKEPERLITLAMLALKQPGDSAPHNDHMHVRVYCSQTDLAYGCVDIGAMELLAAREVEERELVKAVAEAMPGHDELPAPADAIVANASAPGALIGPSATAVPPPVFPDPAAVPPDSATAVWQNNAAAQTLASTSATSSGSSASFNSLFRARTDRIDLRSWR